MHCTIEFSQLIKNNSKYEIRAEFILHIIVAVDALNSHVSELISLLTENIHKRDDISNCLDLQVRNMVETRVCCASTEIF